MVSLHYPRYDTILAITDARNTLEPSPQPGHQPPQQQPAGSANLLLKPVDDGKQEKKSPANQCDQMVTYSSHFLSIPATFSHICAGLMHVTL